MYSMAHIALIHNASPVERTPAISRPIYFAPVHIPSLCIAFIRLTPSNIASADRIIRDDVRFQTSVPVGQFAISLPPRKRIIPLVDYARCLRINPAIATIEAAHKATAALVGPIQFIAPAHFLMPSLRLLRPGPSGCCIGFPRTCLGKGERAAQSDASDA